MNQLEINRALKEHGVEVATIEGDLMVLDVWTVNGEVFKMWVNAPLNTKQLREFLKY